jgi:hypothetical protein
MNKAGTVRRARVRIGSIGALALIAGLAACSPTGFGHHPGSTTTSSTTTTVAAPTCAPKTQIFGGYPVNTTTATPGWYTSDTRQNGNVKIDSTYGDPSGIPGCNSVVMQTGAATGSPLQDKAQLLTYSMLGTPLSSITNVSYSTYRSSLSDPSNPSDAAINIQITGNAGFVAPNGFATLVYEPYNQSGSNAGVTDDHWQNWDATATTTGDGVWWSSKIPYGSTGSQSTPIPWAQMQSIYSDAALAGVGVNIGSNNPNMYVAADDLTVGASTTDF